jgi:DNA-binding PadR family transcriptional regulator
MTQSHATRVLRLIAAHGPMTPPELRAAFAQEQVGINPGVMACTLSQLRRSGRLSWHSGVGTSSSPIRNAITEKGRAWLAKKEAK